MEASAQHHSRGRILAWRLATLSGSLLLTLVALEIGARLMSDVTPGLTESDPLIGLRYARNFEQSVYVSEAGRKVALRFNDVGFRGPTRPRTKPAGVKRIAILGDSMVASLAVDEAQTMVCLLERQLNESATDVRWEVLNFGVNGASPGQELVLYRELVREFQPDLVLCAFFVGNDLADSSSRLSTNPRIYFDIDDDGQLRQEPPSRRRNAIAAFLNRNSYYYVWQRLAFSKASHRVRAEIGQLEPGHWIYSRREPPKVAHAWRIIGKVLQELQREVVTDGGRFGVVMIPNAHQVYEDLFTAKAVALAGEYADAFDANYPDERVAGICREKGIPCLSMLPEFRRAAPHASSQCKDEWLFCNGVGHFNELGDALAARVIQRFITEGDPQQTAGRPLLGNVR